MKPLKRFSLIVWIMQFLACGVQNSFAQCTSYWKASNDTTVCYGSNSGSMQLAGFTGTVYKWEWALSPSLNPDDWNMINNTSIIQNFSNLTHTTYFRAFIKDGNCIAGFTSIVSVTVIQVSLSGNILKDTTVCSNDNNGNLSITGNRGNILKWQYSESENDNWLDIINTNTTLAFNNLIHSRKYRVQVKNGVCPAVYSAIGQVIVNPTPLAEFSTSDVCDGMLAGFNNLSAITSGTLSYNWDFGDDTQSKVKNPNKQYLNPDRYNVTLTAISDKGCRKSIAKEITIHVNPTARFEYNNVCLDYPVIFYNNSSITSSENLSYLWKFGDGTGSILPNPDHYYSSPGVYAIQLIVNSNGSNCKDSITRLVQVYPLPNAYAGNDTTISHGFTVQLNASGGLKYGWMPLLGISNSEISNPLASPKSSTNYVVRVEDTNGCVDKDTVVINVLEDHKVIPTNIITPDGNGENDFWVINNILNYGDCRVRVYNRWGGEVYACDAYQNDWSGKSVRDDMLPSGSYFYIITFKNAGTVYKGTLTILRNE